MSEVRVAVLLPQENTLVCPGMSQPQLFRNENTENLPHYKAAHEAVGKRTLGLPPMSVLHHLGMVDDVVGYSMRPAGRHEINFRDFAVRRFDMDYLLEHGDMLDPTDLALLSIARTNARRWTGNIPVVTRSL